MVSELPEFVPVITLEESWWTKSPARPIVAAGWKTITIAQTVMTIVRTMPLPASDPPRLMARTIIQRPKTANATSSSGRIVVE
jgi:hypothetical protein